MLHVSLTPERSVGKVRKKLPIGIDGFEKIRTNDFYYVDKTLFIKELLQNWGDVHLGSLDCQSAEFHTPYHQ